MVMKKTYLQVITKTGTAYVNAEDPQPYHFYSRNSSPLYRAVEGVFNYWINRQNKDVQCQYFGSFEELYGKSYLDHKGAIAEGVEMVIEYMLENNLKSLTTREFLRLDFDAIFQCD